MALETPRTFLTLWEPQDWLEFRAIARDPGVTRYISGGEPLPDEHVREFVLRQIEGFAARGFCMWKLVLKQTHEVSGFCGLQPLETTEEIEIGWWVARALWGNGLATEAAREALRDAFERVGLERVVAIAHPANRASIRVMEKLGMQYEREMLHRGYPVVLYAISRETWAGPQVPRVGRGD